MSSAELWSHEEAMMKARDISLSVPKAELTSSSKRRNWSASGFSVLTAAGGEDGLELFRIARCQLPWCG